MTTIIPKDTDLTLPYFALVSASAGSGKTTALTRRLLQILISRRIQHNKLPNVLAITFTNNAAAEMKQRTLEYLKGAALGDRVLLESLQEVVDLDFDQLRTRAETLIDEILDNYSDFQVQTIDSFLVRVMRVAAVEFGFPPEFTIVFDNTALLDEAFSLFARDIAQDPRKRSLVEQLVETLNKQRGRDKKFLWNPYQDFSNEVKRLYNVMSSYAAAPGSEAESAMFDENGQGSLRFGDSGSSKDPPTGIAYTYYVPYMRAYALLSTSMKRIQSEKRIVDLSLLNRTLAAHLRAAVVPEIYFSLGERIHHFLIDEFQDTSPIQWAVIRPLIENSLAEAGSLFIVGDTKQAIYTFRGGDWRIMAGMLEGDEFPSVRTKRVTLDKNYRSGEAILDISKEVFHKIVPAQAGAEAAGKSGLSSFEQQPHENMAGRGYVELRSFEKSDLQLEKDYVMGIVQDCVRRNYRFGDVAILTPKNENVIEVSGWLNERGIPFVSLSSLDIRGRKITGELLALLRFLDSPIDNLAFATVLMSDLFRSNLASKRTFDGFLLAVRQGDRKTPLYSAFRSEFESLWMKYFERLFTVVGYLPIYDLVAEVYKTFSVFTAFPSEEATLMRFLEVVRDFEASGTNSLKRFLRHAGESTDEEMWNIAVAPGENAVRVMTVHKAKGLGFPVSIVLLYDTRDRVDNLAIDERNGEIRLIRVTKDLSKDDPNLARLYEGKKLLNKIDELNKLYVSLTRAKEELYVVSIKADRVKFPSAYLPPDGFISGKKSKRSRPDETERNTILGLHVSTRGFAEAKSAGPLSVEERKRGELIHAILERIQYVDTDPRSMVISIVGGLESMRSGLESTTDQLVEFLTGELSSFFKKQEGRMVFNERNIVGSDGKLHRVDRLIVDPDRITVIDYKTGLESGAHHEQVREYTQLVGDIYPGRNVVGLLAYIDSLTVKKVV
jgi:ATP-dependent helicase/nuclease subunit A